MRMSLLFMCSIVGGWCGQFNLRVLKLSVLCDVLVESNSVLLHDLPFERAKLESLEELREVPMNVAKLTRALLLCPRDESPDEFFDDWILFHVENLREMRWTGQP